MRLLKIIYLESPGMNFTDDRSGYLAKSISSKFISSCLDGIDEVWGLESGLILDGLYAGTADCIGIYKGIPSNY